MIFRDREDAGRRLADRLEKYQDRNVLVLALPRGGVPVGYEIARRLHAPLDVIVARKLGAPRQPELGIGAIAPGGVRVLDQYVIQMLGVTEQYIAQVTAQEEQEMRRREQEFRDGLPAPELKGRVVILVDDGLATGVTAMAAVESVRARNPEAIVLAVPVCAPQTGPRLQSRVTELVCLEQPPDFAAVGQWYQNFEQTTDAEVKDLLRRNREELGVARDEGRVESSDDGLR